MQRSHFFLKNSLQSPISDIISSNYKKRRIETMLEVLGLPGKLFILIFFYNNNYEFIVTKLLTK